MWTERAGGSSGSDRPRLLFLGHSFPYPPDGGVFIRTYNVRRLLSRSFQVTTLCFDRKGASAPLAERRADMQAMERFGPVEVVELPETVTSHRKVTDHFRSLVGRRVFTYYKHDSREFESALHRLLRESAFDIVHVDSLDLSRFLPMVEHLPVVCTHHNVESELLSDRTKTESGARKEYVRLQARLQRGEEERWCPRVSLNVTVSDRDRDSLKRIAPEARIETIPNGVDTELLVPDWSAETRGIVFVGGLGWFPNRDALHYFCDDILPAIRTRVGDVETTWVGRAGDDEIHRIGNSYGIRLTGYVPAIEPFLREAACYVIPMRVGGGTRLKLLDAWAMGKAVVSTTQGAEGTEAVHGENIWIADNPESFAEGVQRILEDADLRESLGRKGRETVERVYSWDVIGKKQSRDYLSLLGDIHA